MRKTKKQIEQEREEFRNKLSQEYFERSRKMIRKYVVIGFAFAIFIATILFLSSLSQVPEEPVNPSIGVVSPAPVQVPVNGSDTPSGTNFEFPVFIAVCNAII